MAITQYEVTIVSHKMLSDSNQTAKGPFLQQTAS